MKRIITAVLAALVLFGCGGIKSGPVASKRTVRNG